MAGHGAGKGEGMIAMNIGKIDNS
ncbi:hypothetical protein METHPM2_760025 [Pseudomonas sp. PM2]